jgi:hypothetical protein
MADNNKTTPKYLERDENDPIRLAQEARAAKAAERADMTDREQELLWGREKFTEVFMALKGGKRRTLLGFIQNTSQVTAEEKNKLCDRLEELVRFLRDSIPSSQESKPKAETIDPFA